MPLSFDSDINYKCHLFFFLFMLTLNEIGVCSLVQAIQVSFGSKNGCHVEHIINYIIGYEI